MSWTALLPILLHVNVPMKAVEDGPAAWAPIATWEIRKTVLVYGCSLVRPYLLWIQDLALILSISPHSFLPLCNSELSTIKFQKGCDKK